MDDLCAWLRANSSGIYRKSADAADEIERLRDENAKLRLEVDAWRERFQGYEYRPQDDVVALKLPDVPSSEPLLRLGRRNK